MLLADQYEIPRLAVLSGKILVKDLCASNMKHVMKTLKACTKCDAIDTLVKAARKKVHATPAMIDASHKRDARPAIAMQARTSGNLHHWLTHQALQRQLHQLRELQRDVRILSLIHI